MPEIYRVSDRNESLFYYIIRPEVYYMGADKSLARPGRKYLMFLSEWREFPSAPCLAGALLEDHWAQTALRLREMVGYTGVLISP